MKARLRGTVFTILLAMLFTHQPCDGQTKPEDLGLSAHTLSIHGRVVNYLLSRGSETSLQRKPLFVFIQGSSPRPIQQEGTRNGLPVVKSLLLFKPDVLRTQFHYVVVMKPGVPFFAGANFQASDVYYRQNSLSNRVDDISAVIDDLVSKPWVDRQEVVVVGHSEGSDVAAKIAATNPNVTRVVCLGAGGLSQMYDFSIGIRKEVERGGISEQEGERQIKVLFKTFAEIFEDPSSTTRFWQGETYHYWYSVFSESTTDNLLKSHVPIFVAVGTKDMQVPIESAEATPVEFLRAHNRLLTFVHLPGASLVKVY